MKVFSLTSMNPTIKISMSSEKGTISKGKCIFEQPMIFRGYVSFFEGVPSGKLTWQWKMDLLKMYSLLKMEIFYCHVSLLEGNHIRSTVLGTITYPIKSNF